MLNSNQNIQKTFTTNVHRSNIILKIDYSYNATFSYTKCFSALNFSRYKAAVSQKLCSATLRKIKTSHFSDDSFLFCNLDIYDLKVTNFVHIKVFFYKKNVNWKYQIFWFWTKNNGQKTKKIDVSTFKLLALKNWCKYSVSCI